MEGLLRPVGPEEDRIYWIRRGMALAVLLVLLIGLTFMIGKLGRAETAATPVEVTAAPEAATAVEAAAEPAAEPTAAPVAAPTGGVPDAVATEEAVPVPSTAAVAPSSEPLPPEPANTFHQTIAPANKPATAQDCNPEVMRMALNGPSEVRAGVAVMFKIAVTNLGKSACNVVVDDQTFELKVTSGSNRIWTTKDCVAGMAPRSASVAPGGNLEWQVKWAVDKSKAQCTAAPDKLRAGAYVASAQLWDAAPAQVIMELVG